MSKPSRSAGVGLLLLLPLVFAAPYLLALGGSFDIGGGNAAAGGGSIDGSGASTRVTFWTDADTLSSDADMTYNSTTNVLTINAGTAWTSANDGAASTMDCDLLDAISSAGFCQVAGAGVCNMTGYIGGAITLRDSDNIIAIPNSDGTASQVIQTNGVEGYYGSSAGTGGAVRSTSTTLIAGSSNTRTAPQATFTVGDGVDVSASNEQQSFYGEGSRAIANNLVITINENGTPSTDTTSPNSELIYVACNDTTDGCLWTPATTDVVNNMVYWIVNTGTGVLTVADTGVDATIPVGGLGHCVYNSGFYCSGGAL